MHNKIKYLNEIEANFNTIFFGASTTYRQLDVNQFDILNGGLTNSFNLGGPSVYPPENYYLLKKFLANNNKRKSIKFLLFEITPFYGILAENEHTNRAKYHLNLESYYLMLQYFYHSNKVDKFKSIKKYTVHFIENLLNVGMLQDYFSFLNTESRRPPKAYIDKLEQGRGFYSLEDEINEGNYTLMKRNDDWKQNIDEYRIRVKKTRDIFLKRDSLYLNEYNLKFLKKVKKLADKYNIQILYYVPPKLKPWFYEEILPVLDRMNPSKVINLSDPFIYNDFYLEENSFDNGHLNNKGVEIYTQYFSKIFRETIENIE